MTEDAFYLREGNDFIATEHTRGPWSPEHQHGGPPAALVAWAIEGLPGPGRRVGRLTIDLMRPVPIGRLQVEAEVVAAGRNVDRIRATLTADGSVVLRAAAVRVQEAEVELPSLPDAHVHAPTDPEGSSPFVFPFFRDTVGYHRAMELRIARGRFGEGHLSAWMRMRYPLVAGEQPTPLQRVMAAVDSGSGVSLVLDTARYTFVNADLTVHLQRLPRGDWVCLDARTLPTSEGLGVADSRLYDEDGPLGVAAQTLVVRRR